MAISGHIQDREKGKFVESATVANKPIVAVGAADGSAVNELATRIAGENIEDDVLETEDRSTYTNLTADTLVKTGPGRLKGIFVASGTTPTIKIWDNTSAATTVLINAFTPAVATYYPFPDVEFATGLYVDVGGTIDCTVFWK